MAIIRKNISKGYEPQTQSDIVAAKFPREGARVVTFKSEADSSEGYNALPALGGSFEDEDQFATFAVNTIRMRRCMEWQFTLCDPGKELRWRTVMNADTVSRVARDLQAQAQKAADVLFTQENCWGVRISVDGGIEAAFTNTVPPEDPTLVLTYRRL